MDDSNIIKTYNDGINAVINLVQTMDLKIDYLSTEIGTLKALSNLQDQRIQELESKNNKNSSNSSKPPSSDGYAKSIKNNRQKSGKRTGGQIGHDGTTLEKAPHPDFVVEYRSPDFCVCGQCLLNTERSKRTRQVFDVPPIQLTVTEHVAYEVVCNKCGKFHNAEFPSHITQPAQYGVNIHALLNYFTSYQFIPLARAVEMFKDLFGQTISQGTIVNSAARFSEKVSSTVEVIKSKIIESEVVHFDETGVRSNGKTDWMHVASTKDLTYYEIHKNRGLKATDEIGILPNFQNTAMHDHWKSYYNYKNCTHAECNAHNLRNLKAVSENSEQEWALCMAKLLIEINSRVKSLKENNLTEMRKEELLRFHHQYHEIIKAGILEDAAKSPQVLNKKGKNRKSLALQFLIRLQEFDIETLAFMYDFQIPFDNNLALCTGIYNPQDLQQTLAFKEVFA